MSATGRDIELKMDRTPIAAFIDRDIFHDDRRHLLDHAVKYSPDGGPIYVTASAHGTRV